MASARNIALTGAVTGNANFDGSGNISIVTKQGNIIELTGSINVTPGSTSTIDINYPAGCSKSNIVPVAFGDKTVSSKEWNYGFGMDNSGSSLNGGGTKLLIMNSDKIRIGLTNIASTQKTYYYRLLFMKIA